MTERRATVTFELGKNTFTHEQIVNVRFRGSTIGTITPSETGAGVIVWSLHTLRCETRDGGGPGNGIDIAFAGDGADDDAPTTPLRKQ